jgi:hypothetical protein
MISVSLKIPHFIDFVNQESHRKKEAGFFQFQTHEKGKSPHKNKAHPKHGVHPFYRANVSSVRCAGSAPRPMVVLSAARAVFKQQGRSSGSGVHA